MAERLDPLGRSPTLRRLREQADGGQLPHSLLLVGPEGSGKEAAALALARHVLCARPQGTICGIDSPCPSCRKALQLAHPDLRYSCAVESSLSQQGLREILDLKAAEPLARVRQPGSAIIPIGDPDDPHPVSVRALRRFVGVKPFEAPRRVVVMGEAHRMNRAAANALLKTLEEPPATALLLLCSHQPHLLPSTVRSRCHRVHVPQLPEDLLAGHLVAAHGLSAAEAARLAAVCGGNARRALDLLDPAARALAEGASRLLELLVEDRRTELLAAADRVGKGQAPGKGKKKAADASLSAARDVGMRVLEFLVADLLVLARLESGARLDSSHAERLAALAGRRSPAALAAMADTLLQARGDLARNVNVGLVLIEACHHALARAEAAEGSRWPA